MGEPVDSALFWSEIENLRNMISNLQDRVLELEHPENKCECRECK